MDVDTASCCFQAGHDSLDAREHCLTDLVNAAKKGDGKAWSRLVRRFSPLVRSITYQFRLPTGDAEDVAQVVWLRLFENLDRLRTGCAIPGWIRTTTRHEALRVAKARRRVHLMNPGTLGGWTCTWWTSRSIVTSCKESATRLSATDLHSWIPVIATC